jgi:hypothetical protein
MHAAESLQVFNEGQYGSRNGRRATDPVFIEEELQLEISRATRKPLVLINYDATACYDRIIPNLGMIVSRKFGVPATVTKTNATTLEGARYHIRTELGLSEDSSNTASTTQYMARAKAALILCQLTYSRRVYSLTVTTRRRTLRHTTPRKGAMKQRSDSLAS